MNTDTKQMAVSMGQTVALDSSARPIDATQKKDDRNDFRQKTTVSFLSKKSEKLCTATYMITGFLSDNEPIKWQIRECALQILSDINLVEESVMSDKEHRTKSLFSGVGKIVSLFEIAVSARYISDMNFSILKQEYLSLLDTIAERQTRESLFFTRDFFSVQEERKEDTKEVPKEPTQEPKEKEKEIEKPKSLTPAPPIQVTESVSLVPTRKETEPVEKNSRHETIIRILKDSDEKAGVSIKDIAVHFADCGEKTIQRELTALVENGTLKKTGDRRWSRYSIVAQTQL